VRSTEPVTFPPGRSRLEGHVKSRSGLRTGVVIAGGAGTGIGFYLMFTAPSDEETCDSFGCETTKKLDSGKLLAGSVLAGAGLAATLPNAALSRSPHVAARDELGAGVLPAGLSVTGTF
jgi:hypothetical protein